MDKEERRYTAVLVFIFFFMSVSLAWIWFDWKLAVVVALSLMCSSGNAALRIDKSWRDFIRAYRKEMSKTGLWRT